MTAQPAFMEVDNASRRFAGLIAVDSVSFTLERGEILSVIGPNGAGKTTLFNLITGQLRPSLGHISFKGERIDRLPPHKRAQRGMGRTFQIAKPLHSLTTRENVIIASFLHDRRYKNAYEHANNVLDQVDLYPRADILASELTPSERRRLEVARALALNPELILLDEVMAGLNASEISHVVKLIERLNAGGITFLLIEHNLKVVRTFSKRVLVLDRGAKIAEGTADEALRNEEVIKAYLGNRQS